LENVISAPVEAVVEQGGKFFCWVLTFTGPKRHPVVLGLSNNTRIEIKDGLKDGDVVLKNPRAMVEEARADVKESEKVDVKKKFGNGKAAAAPKINDQPPGGAVAGEKVKAPGEKGRGFPDFKSLDKDGDGKLTQDELPEPMKGFFDNMDTDKNGAVDSKEWAVVRQRMQQMQKMRAEGQGGPAGPGGGP
jgi:hypothetical protein